MTDYTTIEFCLNELNADGINKELTKFIDNGWQIRSMKKHSVPSIMNIEPGKMKINHFRVYTLVRFA